MRSYLKYLMALLYFCIVQARYVTAQESPPPAASTIALGVVMPAAIDGLTDAGVSMLANKLAVIVTNNGLATTDKDQAFIIFPQFVVGGEPKKTSSLMKNIYIANCTVTFFIKQQSTKTIFANITKTLQGSGETREEAIAATVSSINVDDEKYTNFINAGKAQIVAYYQKNCQVFITNASREMLQKHYDAAKKILEVIPQETGQCYTEAQNKLTEMIEAQYGSLDKAMASVNKEIAIEPGDDNLARKLAKIQQLKDNKIENDKTPPKITLISPAVTRGQFIQATVNKSGGISIKGKATDESGINTVTINGKAADQINPDGFFQGTAEKDATDLVITAIDKKGNTASETFHLAIKKEAETTNKDMIPPISENDRYHAIIIANTNYSGKWHSLNTPITEALSLMQLLTSKYSFNITNVDTLFNKNRKETLSAIKNKMGKMTDDDNVIIFYAGHGFLDKGTKTAFWVPSRAEDESDYISNSDITTQISNCNAKHILIMSDACYSGAMRGEDMDEASQNAFNYYSRQMLTSGGIEQVPDESIYMPSILHILQANQNKYYSVRDLYTELIIAMRNQSEAHTKPDLIPLIVDKSEHGDFYFKKN